MFVQGRNHTRTLDNASNLPRSWLSVYDFLSSGRFHKSINSHNILFFSETDTGIPPERSSRASLKDPYFTGFALSRPDDQTASEPQGAAESEVGIHRHLDVQSDAGVCIARFQ
ncbi:hypothetical protein GJ744_002010 [Endocarpon pusillum]|uniref:Uncharacterized protein n=1 Tax=Endocarpon pusillum TaxID=364733 RepID=A0A8H7E2Z9_9EURO|nr:hypothetical protein GJ744_002010 [Endocarpon pusillum]